MEYLIVLMECVPVILDTLDQTAATVLKVTTETPMMDSVKVIQSAHACACICSPSVYRSSGSDLLYAPEPCSEGAQSCSAEVCICNDGYTGLDCCQCDDGYYRNGSMCEGI